MAAAVGIVSSYPCLNSSPSPSKYSKYQSFHPPCRLVCYGGGSELPPPVTPDFKFALHDALDSSGVDTTHAREARQNFMSQIKGLSSIEREVSISINRRVDLANTAISISAEDFALMSQSSLPLPVDPFIERLFDLAMEFCKTNKVLRASPEAFLDSLYNFLYVKKGFHRSNMRSRLEPHPLYLHAVLTYQSGSAYMLALIYSEILKVLRLWSLLDFDCEIFFPHDRYGLPRGYHKQKSAESDHPHILTVQTLLEEILKNVKETFWPFQDDQTKSLFLRAVHAVLCTDRSSVVEERGFHLESAKSSQRRLDRRTLTSLHLGDTSLALSACERLILLGFDPKELRDYSVLLYHCGLYEQSLQYLKLYQDRKGSSLLKQASNELSTLEDDAVEKLMIRLNLISMEEGWSKPPHSGKILQNNSEPS
ncbi:Transglut core2 domain-containing protein [Salix suchowensis]|nr:Transglut core2 domain-containing protein [Salix suchowensis]